MLKESKSEALLSSGDGDSTDTRQGVLDRLDATLKTDFVNPQRRLVIPSTVSIVNQGSLPFWTQDVAHVYADGRSDAAVDATSRLPETFAEKLFCDA